MFIPIRSKTELHFVKFLLKVVNGSVCVGGGGLVEEMV